MAVSQLFTPATHQDELKRRDRDIDGDGDGDGKNDILICAPGNIYGATVGLTPVPCTVTDSRLPPHFEHFSRRITWSYGTWPWPSWASCDC